MINLVNISDVWQTISFSQTETNTSPVSDNVQIALSCISMNLKYLNSICYRVIQIIHSIMFLQKRKSFYCNNLERFISFKINKKGHHLSLKRFNDLPPRTKLK
jgi:hypothetical protein